MDDKLKSALKGIAVIVVALGVAMVAFYKVKDHLSHKDILEDAANSDPNATGSGINSEFEGVFAPSTPIAAGESSFSLFAIIKREVGFGAIAKVRVAGSADLVEIFCSEAKANPNEFFIRCSDPKIGDLTVDGAPDKGKSPSNADFSLMAKVFWRKGTEVILNSSAKFTKINPNAASSEAAAPEAPPAAQSTPPTSSVGAGDSAPTAGATSSAHPVAPFANTP